MKENNLKGLIINIIFLFMITPLLSQSGWDIEYIPINSLNNSYLKKQIFIDVKANESDTINKLDTTNKFNLNLQIRSLLANIREHEIKLSILGKKIVYREDWKIYSDMGLLKDQCLVNSKNNDEVIKDIFLIKILNNTICLKGNLYTSKQVFSAINFEIHKDLIKGFLVKKDNK